MELQIKTTLRFCLTTPNGITRETKDVGWAMEKEQAPTTGGSINW